MLLRLLLLFILIAPLSIQAKSNIDIKTEVGIFLPELKGTIKNTKGSSDFQEDYKYSTSQASSFSLDINFHKTYIPNFYISYLNLSTNMDSTLNKSVTVADADFNSSVSTYIDYSIINAIAYKDFVKKGSVKKIFGYNFYTGDLELDLGLNMKLINWSFKIQDKVDLTKQPSWIDAGLLVPTPYIGMKYYFYNIILYSNMSALSFGDAKLFSYHTGIDYRIIKTIYFSSSYYYESFEAIEKNDTIKFITAGYKFSFIYKF